MAGAGAAEARPVALRAVALAVPREAPLARLLSLAPLLGELVAGRGVALASPAGAASPGADAPALARARLVARLAQAAELEEVGPAGP